MISLFLPETAERDRLARSRLTRLLYEGEPMSDPTPLTDGLSYEGRYMTWRKDPPVPGETRKEARARQQRNRERQATASAYNGAWCECGHVRANVVHATDPSQEPEGEDYYRDIVTHPFVERQPEEEPMSDPTPLKLVQQQAEDEGLWFIAETAPEAYLQQELRRLHEAVERDAARAAPSLDVANPVDISTTSAPSLDETLAFPDHTHQWTERSQDQLDAEYRETGALIGRWYCPGCWTETDTEPDGVLGWRWECASCDRPVPSMGMCRTCGVFGVMRLDAGRSAPSLDVDAFLHSLTERPELSPDWREGIEYARLSLAAEYARIKEQP